MTNLEYIKELDKRIDLINLQWSGEIANIINSKKNKKNPAWGEQKIAQINNRYAYIMATVISERQQSYDAEYALQQQAYEDSFVPKTPESTKEQNKIRAHGEWVNKKDNQ